MEVPNIRWLLDCEPRPVQIEALRRSFGGVICQDHINEEVYPRCALSHYRSGPAIGWGHFLDMRCGKTPTLLNEYALFHVGYGLSRLFIASPNRYKYTWQNEIYKFMGDRKDLPVHVFESTNRKAFYKWFRQVKEQGILIANYEAFRYEENLSCFEDFFDRPFMMAADESVYMKNNNGLISKRVLEVSKGADITRPMSGKPAPQSIADFYMQLRFAKALEGVNFFQFRNRYAKMGGFKGKKVVGIREERLGDWYKLRNSTSFVARRKDWGGRIECDYETVVCSVTEKQKKAYIEMEKDFVTFLDSGDWVSVEQVITSHMKLQQISSGFIVDQEGIPREIEPIEKTGKFQELIDRLENEVNCKVLIFAVYNETLDRLFSALRKFNPAVIRGSQHMKKLGLNIETEKARFNEDPSCRIMLGQEVAIKYGHTLMGSEDDPCLASFYYENTYSLDDRSQTEERNQGYGQIDAIHVQDLVCSPIEQKVVEALQRKEKVSEIILAHYKG